MTRTSDSNSNMSKKQIKDLKKYARELAKEGLHDAAREVLSLIDRK